MPAATRERTQQCLGSPESGKHTGARPHVQPEILEVHATGCSKPAPAQSARRKLLVEGWPAPLSDMRRTLVTVLVAATLVVAGLVLAAPAPADAATSVYGYVWANQPSTSSYLANTGYELNSTGGDIEVIRWEEGRYRVRFAGMGSWGGVAHVRAYGTTANICTVASWSHGIDLSINIRCFDSTGALADTQFVAHFTNRTVARGSLAYFWADTPTAAGQYQPFHTYAYDSTGVPSQVERTGTGNYLVYINALSALYPNHHDNGHLQVTAYNMDPVQCGMRLVGDENPTPLGVSCHDTDGNPVDSRFTVSYSHGVSHLGTTGTRGNAYIRNSWNSPTYVAGWWTSNGSQPVVSHTGTGTYWVRFPGLGTAHGHVTVSSQEIFGGSYCSVGFWYRHPIVPDEVVHVRCYDGVTHAPVDYDFGVSFHA